MMMYNCLKLKHASINALGTLLNDQNHSTIVLTSTKRVAGGLQALYRNEQKRAGEISWLSPTILPFDSWLNNLYLESLTKAIDEAPPLLLTPLQSTYLWSKIVKEQKSILNLIRVDETAKLMQSAWSLLKRWRINLTQADCQDYADYLLLLSCIEKYESLCQSNHWLDNVVLPYYLIRLINQSSTYRADLPDRIILSGFTALSPLVNWFLAQLALANIELMLLTSTDETNSPIAFEASTDLDEYQAMAAWAKLIHEKHPSAKIACVVPHLATVQDRITATFEETFFQENQYHVRDSRKLFTIAAEVPLHENGLVKIALQLLNIQRSLLSAEELANLLHSSYLGGFLAEARLRETFALTIKRLNLPRLSLDDPRHNHLFAEACPILHRRISIALDKLKHAPGLQSIGAWTAFFSEVLQIYGWPGEIMLETDLYQIAEKWLQLGSKLATLEVVAQPMAYNDALALLIDLTENTTFRAESSSAPIEILELDEASGMPFEYMWLAGVDDTLWPPKPKPHPLIPKSLQISHQMPHSSSILEYESFRLLFEQFKCYSNSLICSYAKEREHIPRHPSPFLSDIAIKTSSHLEFARMQSNFSLISSAASYDYFYDEQGIEHASLLPVKGGAHAIKAQSNCPFKAFAEWRLFLKSYSIPTNSLQPNERGLILHDAMALIWQTLKNKNELDRLNESALNRLILKFIKLAMSRHSSSTSHYFYYLKFEKKRLFFLIKKWLQMEKERPFFSIADIEKKITVHLAGLELIFRLDRVDYLEKGDKFIIDNKSGTNNQVLDWFSERPTDPQLILYLFGVSDNCAAISFAEINHNLIGFKGVSQYPIDIPHIKPLTLVRKEVTWPEQLQTWQNMLEQVCREFANGDARVMPAKLETTCAHCTQQPFCRIKETLHEPCP